MNLVGSGDAAAAVHVSTSTLYRAWQAGKLDPAEVTPGGHARWDLDDLRRQLAALHSPRATPGYVRPVSDAPVKPPVATAIVVSHLGVLIERRRDGRPPYTFVAGEIEPGESVADAAVRETKEETGIDVVAAGELIGDRIHPRTGAHMHYLACLPRGSLDAVVGDPDELAEVFWVPSLRELDELMGAGAVYSPVHDHLSLLLAR